jgi:hypothetical protein
MATAVLAAGLGPPRVHPLADHGSLKLGEHALTSEILPPVKAAFERNIGQDQSSSKILSRVGNPTDGRFRQRIECHHRQ